MQPNPGPGKLIVIEGLDGAGTTTQARLLGERLAQRGPVRVTWQPSERPAGLLIRRLQGRPVLWVRRATLRDRHGRELAAARPWRGGSVT